MIFSGITIYIHDIVLCILLVYGYIYGRKKQVTPPKLLWPIISFFVAGCLSLLLNAYRFNLRDVGFSSLYLVRWSLYAGLYLLLTQSAISSSFLLSSLYLVGSGLSILGFIQFIWYPQLQNLSYLGWDPHYYRLFSTFLDPNFVGIFIVLTLFLGFYLMRKRNSVVMKLLQVVNAGALFLTYSRSSYLALVIGLTLWLIWTKKWKLGIAIAVGIVILLLLPTPGGKTLRLLRVDSSIARVENWQETVQLIEGSPVIGYGFDTLRYIHKDVSVISQTMPISRSAAGVDSSILFLIVTTGLLGIASYGWILWSVIQLFKQSLKRIDNVLLFICSIAAMTVHSLFTNSFFYPWILIWFWVFIASSEMETFTGSNKRRS